MGPGGLILIEIIDERPPHRDPYLRYQRYAVDRSLDVLGRAGTARKWHVASEDCIAETLLSALFLVSATSAGYDLEDDFNGRDRGADS